MQLKTSPPLSMESATLALAVSQLFLATLPAHANATTVEQSTLLYKEKGRVQVFEPVIQVRHELKGSKVLSVRFAYDALSGSSPNGARPTSQAATFTSPSGDSYTADAGELPKRRFRDMREALSVDLEMPLEGVGRFLTLGVNGSHEGDYDAVGASASLRWDLFDRHSTLSVGLATSYEIVSPDGGLHDPMSFFVQDESQSDDDDDDHDDDDHDDDDHEGGGGGTATKQVHDVLFTWSQVMNPAWLLQANWGYGLSDGYQSDPYKLVSLLGSDGSAVNYLHEGRPEQRARQTFLLRSVHHLERVVLRFSWRYFTDDWGVHANTFKAAWWVKPESFFGQEGWRFCARTRYHQQGAADLFVQSLDAEAPLPAFASADTRLAELDAVSYGLRADTPASALGSFHLGLDHYIQTWNLEAEPFLGVDPAPDLKTWMLTLGWKKSF
jgi:hypothetical protein